MAAEQPSWTTLLGMGSVSAGIFVAGLGLGWWLDSILHTSPVLVLVGVVLGIAGAVCYTFVRIRTFFT
jgi:F0F1-type ATP synthase assembly protein I